MQRIFLVSSGVLSGVVGLATIPIIARHLDPEQMAAVSLILLISTLLGLADVLRPVFVRGFVLSRRTAQLINIRPALSLSSRVGVLLSAALFFGGVALLGRYFDARNMLFLAIGAFFFFVSITFWSVLDSIHRVGTAQLMRAAAIAALYIAYCGISVAGLSLIYYSLAFAAVQLLLLLAYGFAVRHTVSLTGSADDLWTLSDVRDTLQTNASKLINDFTDRLVFARFFPADLFAGYAITYELAARINVVPQYISTYLYPRLCAAAAAAELDQQAPRYFALAAINFIGLATLAVVIAPFASTILGMYAGAAYQDQGYLLTYLILVSAVYSLAFYGQAFIRATGDFRGLANAFSLASILGIVLGAIMWALWGLHVLVLAVVFLKVPGVGMMLHLIETRISRRAALAAILLVGGAIGLVTMITFKDRLLTAFTLAGALLIASCIQYSLRRSLAAKRR